MDFNDYNKTVQLCQNQEWSFIPVNNDKIPTLPKWKPYQSRIPIPSEIASWSNCPKLAVVTGRISNIVVLDIDDGGYISITRHHHLPITPCVKTPNNGYHYYFRYPDISDTKKLKTVTNLLTNIDVRADGGYALIPFSNGYEWIEGLSKHYLEMGKPLKREVKQEIVKE